MISFTKQFQIIKKEADLLKEYLLLKKNIVSFDAVLTCEVTFAPIF